jgi:hypothetical protein
MAGVIPDLMLQKVVKGLNKSTFRTPLKHADIYVVGRDNGRFWKGQCPVNGFLKDAVEYDHCIQRLEAPRSIRAKLTKEVREWLLTRGSDVGLFIDNEQYT